MPNKAPLRIHSDSYWLHFEENLLSSFIYSAVFIDPEKKPFLRGSDVKRSD